MTISVHALFPLIEMEIKWLAGKLMSRTLSWRQFSGSQSGSGLASRCPHLHPPSSVLTLVLYWNCSHWGLQRLSNHQTGQARGTSLLCWSLPRPHSTKLTIWTSHPLVFLLWLCVFLLCFLQMAPLLAFNTFQASVSQRFNSQEIVLTLLCLGDFIHYLDFTCQRQTKENKSVSSTASPLVLKLIFSPTYCCTLTTKPPQLWMSHRTSRSVRAKFISHPLAWNNFLCSLSEFHYLPCLVI